MECMVMDYGCGEDKQTTLLENIWKHVIVSKKPTHVMHSRYAYSKVQFQQ